MEGSKTVNFTRAYGYTGNDRYSGHGYSGIDRYSGTKTPDDAILFTVSGITAIVELFWGKIFKKPSYFQK